MTVTTTVKYVQAALAGPSIFRRSAHEGGKIVSRMLIPLLPTGKIRGTHFYQRLSRLQGHIAAGRNKSTKIPKTPPGIEPATFLLVAQW